MRIHRTSFIWYIWHIDLDQMYWTHRPKALTFSFNGHFFWPLKWEYFITRTYFVSVFQEWQFFTISFTFWGYKGIIYPFSFPLQVLSLIYPSLLSFKFMASFSINLSIYHRFIIFFIVFFQLFSSAVETKYLFSEAVPDILKIKMNSVMCVLNGYNLNFIS